MHTHARLLPVWTFTLFQVYGSVVASRYSNQHSLALDKMSVSSECFYQPRVQSDFDADTESLDQQLGKYDTSLLAWLLVVSLPRAI